MVFALGLGRSWDRPCALPGAFIVDNVTAPYTPPPRDISQYQVAGVLMVVIGGAAELIGWIVINGPASAAFTVGGVVLGFLGVAFLGTAEELAGERSHPDNSAREPVGDADAATER